MEQGPDVFRKQATKTNKGRGEDTSVWEENEFAAESELQLLVFG